VEIKLNQVKEDRDMLKMEIYKYEVQIQKLIAEKTEFEALCRQQESQLKEESISLYGLFCGRDPIGIFLRLFLGCAAPQDKKLEITEIQNPYHTILYIHRFNMTMFIYTYIQPLPMWFCIYHMIGSVAQWRHLYAKNSHQWNYFL
jgi:hypothetical protein